MKQSLAGVWLDDADAPHCGLCHAQFRLTRRRHHCRCCGGVYCGTCASSFIVLEGLCDTPQRVCAQCYNAQRGAKIAAKHARSHDRPGKHSPRGACGVGLTARSSYTDPGAAAARTSAGVATSAATVTSVSWECETLNGGPPAGGVVGANTPQHGASADQQREHPEGTVDATTGAPTPGGSYPSLSIVDAHHSAVSSNRRKESSNQDDEGLTTYLTDSRAATSDTALRTTGVEEDDDDDVGEAGDQQSGLTITSNSQSPVGGPSGGLGGARPIAYARVNGARAKRGICSEADALFRLHSKAPLRESAPRQVCGQQVDGNAMRDVRRSSPPRFGECSDGEGVDAGDDESCYDDDDDDDDWRIPNVSSTLARLMASDETQLSSMSFLSRLQENVILFHPGYKSSHHSHSPQNNVLTILLYISEQKHCVNVVTVDEGETLRELKERLAESFYKLLFGPFKPQMTAAEREALLAELRFSNEFQEIGDDQQAMKVAEQCTHLLLSRGELHAGAARKGGADDISSSAFAATELPATCSAVNHRNSILCSTGATSSVRDFFRSEKSMDAEDDEAGRIDFL